MGEEISPQIMTLWSRYRNGITEDCLVLTAFRWCVTNSNCVAVFRVREQIENFLKPPLVT